MRPLILLLFILNTALIISCNSNRNRTGNKQKPEQSFLLHGPIQESTAPKNLTAYFDSLQQQGFFIPYHTDSTEQQKVIHTVALLQKYQIGERKYYPTEEVQAALELMRHELGYRQNHRGEELTTEETGFFFRFLEQAARLCLDVHLLADVASADHKVGVINFQESSYNPLYSFLLYENGKGGWNTVAIDTTGYVKIEKIFTLQKDGQTYYLLSNNFQLLGFSQFIFMIENGIASLFQGKQYEESINQWCEFYPEDATIIFNPQKICWNFCHKVGEHYQQIEGTKTLYLELAKEQSYFHVE